MGIVVDPVSVRRLSARFEAFPGDLHDRLLVTMRSLVDRMQVRGRAAAPFRRGTLCANIVGSVYDDAKGRIAGYLSVYDSSGNPRKEYPKAATWEYGTNKIRKIRASALHSFAGKVGHERLMARVAKPMNIVARRYLRGTLEGIRSEAQSEFAADLDATAAQEE